ncbi:hypothetical protein TRFO_35241 [Tritrichomonas foetus]|uniref:Uncharacterized protein n=1 Tax=Tritrichomonas foetus TaxID=1144522 RepID=A0A1J4JGV0_9EUKA|nr:hypothetical protein TRFO_35241 [Tritrichomonas foetus]|eukprot:OHS98392.1 hypothetical protein TRFO_35241 [Tritrichomonas foetus]
MTDSNQIARIQGYIQEIYDHCAANPNRLEVAITNLQALKSAITSYERAPRYYNAIFEDNDVQPIMKRTIDNENDQYKHPVIGELEKIFDRKLKQSELKDLAKALSEKIQLRLDRDTKRSKIKLLQWFSNNWEIVHQKIYEFNFNKMAFDDQTKK